jgi:carboxypeptidase family protein
MTRSRIAMVFVVALAGLALPATARAQSAFAGVVKDTTGAVLPGVTVEASSPALIEKVRSVTTDSNGAYKIENLRPGIYTITFNLTGFSTVKKDGVELASNFTATINADLKVGAVEETVTVSGESPVVDVQSNVKAQVLPREVLDAVPSAHTLQSVGQLVVGVTLTAPDVGGSQAMQQTYFTVHGLGAAQTSVLIDGMIVNGLQGDGAIQSYLNEGANQEMVYQTGGGNVDAPTGGVKINLVPKEGGNRFSGSLFEGYESRRFQASNGNDFLYSHGVTSLDQIGTYSDTDFTQGGPLKKDMLWFFGSGRLFTVNKPIASTVVSDGTSAGALACYTGAASCAQGVDDQHQYSVLARLTWQMSPRNKLSAYMDRIHKVRGAAMDPGDDQATSSVRWNSPNYTTATVKYTSTVSSRLLLEGGYSTNIERYNNLYAQGVEKPYGSAEWLATARHYDSTFGRRWIASDAQTGQYPDRYNAQGSATYVTGTHSLKLGFQDSWGVFNHVSRRNADLYQNYQTINGVLTPQTVTVYNTPVWSAERLNSNLGLYGQDVWTLKHVTFTIGGRWENVKEEVIGQPAQNGRFGHELAFDDVPMPTWQTFSPRTAAVIDVFGNGKTAVRAGFNRYQSAATTTLASLYNPSSVVSQSLPWTDLNRDDIAQGDRGCVYLSAGCEINFASLPSTFGIVSLASPDPELKRPFVDQYNVGVTHEVLRGVSVSAEWFHNDSKNIMLRTNVLRPGTYNSDGTVTNPSYRAITVFSPIDGTPITAYDVTAASASQTRNVDTNDAGLKQSYNAFEFNINARLGHGARLFGGTATDRTVANTCAAAATNPNFLMTVGGVNYCDQSNSGIPWRTQWKIAGTYPLPWYGIVISGSYQGLPGYLLGTSALTAGGAGAPNFTNISGLGTNMTVTSTTRYAVCPGNSASQGCVVGALIAPGALSSLTVPLVAPGIEQTPRLNQVDFSIGKRFQIGSFRFDPKIDLFNALNSSDYFTVRTTSFTPTAAANVSAGTYMFPGSILQGRLLRIAAVVNW